MNDSITQTKVCRRCGVEKPATNEYFHRNKNGVLGLHAYCKPCQNEASRKWQETNPEKFRESMRKYESKRERTVVRKNNPRIRKSPEEIKAKEAESKRLYRIKNRAQIDSRQRRWYQENSERLKARQKENHKRNKDRDAETSRQWRKRNPEKLRAARHRRKALLRGLPNNFTGNDWKRALDYWGGCCAICGNQLRDLFGDVEPHADHWIPLAHKDCPGTTVDNMLPLCSTCNLSKNVSWPHDWVERKFGKRKAKQIIEKIEIYFEWAKGLIIPT